MTQGSSVAHAAVLRGVLIMATVVTAVLAAAGTGFAWGPEGHKAVAILTQQYLLRATRSRVRELLGSESMEEASIWADQISHQSRSGTEPWHYINIPLRASKVDLNRDCPGGQCVLVKTQEFLSALGNPHTDRDARREALKFVIHFVADLHQPLHCEDHRDRGGNSQRVIFEGHPDNLHWVWDTGLVQEINGDPRGLAAGLGREIRDQERISWQTGSIEDWVLESHRLAQTTAYRWLWAFGPAVLNRGYDDRAEAAIKQQLEKASVRLAYLLNQRLN